MHKDISSDAGEEDNHAQAPPCLAPTVDGSYYMWRNTVLMGRLGQGDIQIPTRPGIGRRRGLRFF